MPSPSYWQCRLAAWVIFFLSCRRSLIYRQWSTSPDSERMPCLHAGSVLNACLGRAQLMCWLKPTGPGIVLRSCFLCLHVKAPLSLWSITAGAKHRPLELARGKFAVRTPRLQREAIMIAEERKKWSTVLMVSLKRFILLPWYTESKYYTFIRNMNCHQGYDICRFFKDWQLKV